MNDDDFKPLLGRKRHTPQGQANIRASERLIRSATGLSASLKKRFSLSRIGRAAVVGSLLAQKARRDASARRRVTVKIRLVRLSGSAKLRGISHMRYLEREGIDRMGHAPQSYSAVMDRADKTSFFDGTEGDRHQFHIIVSPEDGDQLVSLTSYVRGLMAQVAEDLATNLEWLATDHFNTGHPHTHILLRGVTETGSPLIIARDYIRHGFRERASEQLLLQLGPRLEVEQTQAMRREVDLAKPIELDQRLLKDRSENASVRATHDDPFEQALRTRRLQTLELLGLAEPIGPLLWRLDETLLDQLTVFEKQSARIDYMRSIVSALGQDRGAAEYRRLETGDLPATGLVGTLLQIPDTRPANGMTDLLIDSVDGRVYSIEMAAVAEASDMQAGMIIKIYPHQHMSDDRSDGRTGPPYQDELRMRVKILSHVPLIDLPHYDGPTWLDEPITNDEMPPIRDAGFGQDLRSAQRQRQQWLMEQGLLDETGDLSRIVSTLRQREFLRVAERFADETGLEFADHDGSTPAAGIFRRQVNLPRGRFALFEHGFQFSLVPWEPAFEKLARSRLPGLDVDDSALDWQGGRGRQGPTIG
jgi:hypothetical protein